MGTQGWKTVLAGVSAAAALAAVALAVVAVLGYGVGWPAVITMAGTAVVSAVLSLAAGAGSDAEGRHQ